MDKNEFIEALKKQKRPLRDTREIPAGTLLVWNKRRTDLLVDRAEREGRNDRYALYFEVKDDVFFDKTGALTNPRGEGWGSDHVAPNLQVLFDLYTDPYF